MIDDRPAFAARVAERGALNPLTGVGAGALVGALGDGQALDPDPDPGQVHHQKHVFDAAVLLARQIAHRALVLAIEHDRRGAGVDAQLVFQRGAADLVGLAQGAVAVDQHLGHDVERNALDPRRPVGAPRQHHVDDVLGQVVIAVGDENFSPLMR